MGLILIQMRHSARHLLGVSLAIVLGVAFVTCTLIAGAVFERLAWNSVAAQYDGADAIVTPLDEPITDRTVEQLGAVKGVASADGRLIAFVEATAGSRSSYPIVGSLPTAPSVRDALDLSSGRLPAAAGEVAVLAGVAHQLESVVGDTISLNSFEDDAVTEVAIVGIIARPNAIGGTTAPDIYAWPSDVADLTAGLDYASILLTAAPGTSPEQLVGNLNASLDGTMIARTRDEQARFLVADVSGDTDILTLGLLAFAVIALFVAGIVIANTFTILVAQRTRNLALLRCVGATRAQIRRSVLTEAIILGVGASAVGVLLGVGVMTAGVRISHAVNSMSVVATDTPIPLTAVAVPLVLGIVATLVAAWGPARGATRVAPLAALRPAALEAISSPASKRRIALALLLIGAGALGLLAGVVLSLASPSAFTVLIGVGGGLLSFLGVVVGSVLIVPRAVQTMGAVVGRFGGAAARIAASNSSRNPKRTAATATALLIAVTLVTMMSVGAESTKSTLSRAIDERSPIDLVIASEGQTADDGTGDYVVPGLPPAVAQTLTANPDISSSTPVRETQTMIDGAPARLIGVDPGAARRISRAPAQLEGLASGTVLVPDNFARSYGVADGDRLRVGEGASQRELVARVADLPDDDLVVTDTDLLALDPAAPASRLWVRFADGANAGETVGDVQDALAGISGIVFQGGAEEKQSNDRILDSVLLVVTALLGVAVVIALVGVGNTLSLSVIERTRESAILRAIGLTRGQLRWMLAIEGVLIALVGAAIGIILGTVYGMIGALTLLGNAWGVSFAVPPGRLALIVVIAILAGLLASVLPARSAVRMSPVAALAE